MLISFLCLESYDKLATSRWDSIAMAALLGKLEPFDVAQEEWPQYIERLEQFFVANDIVGDEKAEKRRATFLSVIGSAPYKLLRSLLSPSKPTEKTFEQLMAVLTEHYNP